MEDAGFSVVGVFADADGSPIDRTVSSTMWIVGQQRAATLVSESVRGLISRRKIFGPAPGAAHLFAKRNRPPGPLAA